MNQRAAEILAHDLSPDEEAALRRTRRMEMYCQPADAKDPIIVRLEDLRLIEIEHDAWPRLTSLGKDVLAQLAA